MKRHCVERTLHASGVRHRRPHRVNLHHQISIGVWNDCVSAGTVHRGFLNGYRLHRAIIHRWAVRGIRDRKFVVVRMVGNLYTMLQAIREFLRPELDESSSHEVCSDVAYAEMSQ